MGFEADLNPGLWGLIHCRTTSSVITAEVFAYLKALRKFGTQQVDIKQPETSSCRDLSKR